MMKIIGRIVFALCILFLLKDCLGLFYIKMTHLSKTDLEWVKSSDAVFETDSGRIARLTDMGSYVYNETNPFYISSAGGWEYEANAGYHYSIGLNGYEIDGNFAIQRSADTDSLEFDARLDRLSTRGYIPMDLRSMELNGRIFDDCLVVDTTNAVLIENHFHDNNRDITKFVINKRFGLIYYEFDTGEKYYRKFKTRKAE